MGINIFIFIAYVLLIGYTNGAIALNIRYMKYSDKEKAVRWKGRWHLGIGLVNFLVVLSFSLFTPGNFFYNFLLFFSIYFALYDVSINFARKFFKWEFVGTCEKYGSIIDFDCITKKIDKIIGIKFVRTIILFIAFYLRIKFGN